jgi:molybdopterin/thiamine biosynthesis adenylyltransferase
MSYIGLKESLAIVKESNSIYQFIFTSSRNVKRFSVDNLVTDLISELTDFIPLDKIYSRLESRYSSEVISQAISSLEKEGIIRVRPEKKIALDRQLLFIDEYTSSWDETITIQKKINNSSVLILGLGGVGSWIANGCNQIGIGTLGFLDDDIVDETNLNRQFFSLDDLNRKKTDVFTERFKNKKIFSYDLRINSSTDFNSILENYDLIINCMDSPSVQQTSQWLDAYANKNNIPYIVAGGYNLHIGMIGPLIIPGITKTLDDFLKFQRDNDPLANFEKIKDIQEGGNLGPVAGTIANLQTMEIFKYFSGISDNNINKFAEFNVMNYQIDWRHY